MAEHDPEARWTELAAALKHLRIMSGLTGRQLAEQHGWSQAKVSKIENRLTRPSVEDVRLWAVSTGASSSAEVEALAEIAADLLVVYRSWRTSLAAGAAARQNTIAELEVASTSIRSLQNNVIPGLLQVPEYAEQIFRMLGRSAGDAAAGAAARMNRQGVLYQPEKTFTFILGEAALRWRPAFADVRQAQADRLVALSRRPNVTIAVLPFSKPWPVFSVPSFLIFGVPGDPKVLIEDSDGEKELSGETAVETFEARFTAALKAAVKGAAATRLIRDTVH